MQMSKYSEQMESFYVTARDFLYELTAKNPEYLQKTVDEIADLIIVESKNWRVWLPDGIKRTMSEKAAIRVISNKSKYGF